MSNLEGSAWLQSKEKYLMDRALCVALAVPVGATALTAAGLIGLIDGVNPIFRQNRYGDAHSNPFKMIKLRTMPRETDDMLSAGPNDERASKLGKVLRRSHIDEFPQLVNIWKGEMSFVGPRPLTLDTIEYMMDLLTPSEQIDFKKSRKVARPGVVDPYNAFAYHVEGESDLKDMALGHIDYARSATPQT